MDWKSILEIAITTVATGITTFVLSTLKRHKNTQLENEKRNKDNQIEIEKRLTSLESYQNANYDHIKEIKKDLDIIRDYIVKNKKEQ